MPNWPNGALICLYVVAELRRRRRRSSAFGSPCASRTAVITRPSFDVVVVQAEQRDDRRPQVDVVGPRLVVDAVRSSTPGPDQAEPGVPDLVLDVAVVPGEASGRRTRRRSAPHVHGFAVCEEEVGVAEQRERRRPLRVGVDHVQRLLLDRVGEPLARSARRRRPAYGSSAVAPPTSRSSLRTAGSVRVRLAVDVERRRVVEVDVERRLARRQRAP